MSYSKKKASCCLQRWIIITLMLACCCRMLFAATNTKIQCREGWKRSIGKCVDLDECRTKNPKCNGKNMGCLNLKGSFRCNCTQKGMQGNGKYCGYALFFVMDVDENDVIRKGAERRIQKFLFGDDILEFYASTPRAENSAEIIITIYTTKDYFTPQEALDIFRKRESGLVRRSGKIWKLPKPVRPTSTCVETEMMVGYEKYIFQKTEIGRVSESIERCPEKPPATISCKGRNASGIEVAYFDYQSINVTSCTEMTTVQEITTLPITTANKLSSSGDDNNFSTTAIEDTTVAESVDIDHSAYAIDATSQIKFYAATTAATPGTTAPGTPDPMSRILVFRPSLYSSYTTTQTSDTAPANGNTTIFIPSTNSDKNFTSVDREDTRQESTPNADVNQSPDKEFEASLRSFRHDEWTLEDVFNLNRQSVTMGMITENKNITTEWVYAEIYQANISAIEGIYFEFNDTEGLKNEVPKIQAYIPSEAFLKSSPRKTNECIPASFIFYKNTSIFHGTVEEIDQEILNVLAVNVEGRKVENLDEPFWFQFSLDAKPRNNSNRYFKCVYLDEEHKVWSTKGCRYSGLHDKDSVNCTCDHLTIFAVLVKNVEFLHKFQLDILGKVGCSISIIGLVFMLAVYLSFTSLRKTSINLIHINLSMCLLIAYIIFVSAVERTEILGGCIAIAAVLHFFFLSAWGWMVVECVTMYKKLVIVLTRIGPFYVRKAAAIVYTTSLAIVCVTLAVTVGWYDNTNNFEDWYPDTEKSFRNTSIYVSERICWLQGYPLYIGFLLPVGMGVAFCFSGFLRISKAITCDRKKVKSSLKKSVLDEIKSYLFRASVISFLFGLTWLSAIPLTVTDDRNINSVSAWVFSICTSLQGFFIFIFFCITRKDVRQMWIGFVSKKFSITTSENISKTTNQSSEPGTPKTRRTNGGTASMELKGFPNGTTTPSATLAVDLLKKRTNGLNKCTISEDGQSLKSESSLKA